ncbi:MAG TPA: hypothetical protein VIC63_04990, partial [Candidatus Limnocylindria bacterium]
MLRLTALTRPAAFAAVLALVLTGLGPAAPAPRQGPISVHTSESSRAVDGPTDFELADGTTHIAIRWAGHPDAHLTAAFSRDGTTFDEPQHVDLDEVGEAKHDGETYGVIMVASHARVVRVTTDEPLDKVTVLALDAGAVATPLPGVGATASGVTG